MSCKSCNDFGIVQDILTRTFRDCGCGIMQGKREQKKDAEIKKMKEIAAQAVDQAWENKDW